MLSVSAFPWPRQALFLLRQVEHGEVMLCNFQAQPLTSLAASASCLLEVTPGNKKIYPETAMLRETSTTWRGVGNWDTVERKRSQGVLRCQTHERSSHFGSGSSSSCCPGWHHIYQSWAAVGKTFLNFWFINPWAKEKECLKSLSFGVAFYTARDD